VTRQPAGQNQASRNGKPAGVSTPNPKDGWHDQAPRGSGYAVRRLASNFLSDAKTI